MENSYLFNLCFTRIVRSAGDLLIQSMHRNEYVKEYRISHHGNGINNKSDKIMKNLRVWIVSFVPEANMSFP